MCWLCGEVGHKVAECGGNGRRGGVVDTVEEVDEVVVADVGGVWTVAAVEQGWTKVGGLRRSTKKEAALRRRSMSVAVVHKNKFGVLVVDPGDQAVCTIEAAVKVWEVEVGACQYGDHHRLSSGRVRVPAKVYRSIRVPDVRQTCEVSERKWRSDLALWQQGRELQLWRMPNGGRWRPSPR